MSDGPLGLRFGNLPNGVNSHIIGRIFEEGWPAALQMLAAFMDVDTGPPPIPC